MIVNNILVEKLESSILKKYDKLKLEQVKDDINNIVESFSKKPWVLQENIFKG